MIRIGESHVMAGRVAHKKGKKIGMEGRIPAFLAIDFFCGAGGTTRGLIDAGGHVIAGIDKASECKDTYTKNNVNEDGREAGFLNLDIFDKTEDHPSGQGAELGAALDERIHEERSRHPSVPLMFAICAPCQPFTKMSKKELTEERANGRKRDRNLLLETLKCIEKYAPEMIMSENVAGISDPKYGGVWDEFKDGLREMGYALNSKVVCASKFGVPQFRKRSILIAVKRDILSKDALEDVLGNDLKMPAADPSGVVKTVRQALEGFPRLAAGEMDMDSETWPNHRARALSDINLKRISSAKPGENNIYMKNTEFGDLTLPCHRKALEKNGFACFGDVYTRMHPDRPSPTITTKCNSISNGRFGHYDVTQNRGITPREAAELQSFPRDYVFYPIDSGGSASRMIGNAVPPLLAQFFASYMRKSLLACKAEATP